MKSIVFYLLFMTVLEESSITQEDYFDILFHNKIVGELKTTKVTKDHQIIYSNYTVIEAHLLKSITISNDSEVVFDADYLSKADAAILVNQKIHQHTRTDWIGTRYRVRPYEKDEKFISDRIRFSVVRLLFEEPKNVDQVFSEASGEFHKIVYIGDHSYDKINLKGHHNHYYYKKGLLEKAVVDEGVIKYEIKRREINH